MGPRHLDLSPAAVKVSGLGHKVDLTQVTVGRIRCSHAVGLRSSVPRWQSPGDLFCSLLCGPFCRAPHNMAAGFIRVSLRENANKMEVTVFCDLVTEGASHHLCAILFMKSSH